MAKNISSIVFAFLVFLSITVCAQCDISVELKEQFLKEVGTHELTGHNDGIRVEQYIVAAGFNAKSQIPWCAAFIYWNFKELGYTLDIKYPALASAYFDSTKVIYKRGEGFKCKPNAGDVIGIYFPSKGRIAHVGFYLDETDKYFITIEGNTNRAGSREGDGVLKKYRPKRSIYKISRFF